VNDEAFCDKIPDMLMLILGIKIKTQAELLDTDLSIKTKQKSRNLTSTAVLKKSFTAIEDNSNQVI